MKIKNGIRLFVGLLIITLNANAQTLSPFVISSTGGSSSGSELSWTIGETFTETFIGGNNILTQGFQQPELQVNMGSVPTNLCASAHFTIPYTAFVIISMSNVFIAELSDKNGSFASPTIIGSVTSNMSGSINAIIPNPIQSGSQYSIRIRSTSPVFVSSPAIGISIKSNPCYEDSKNDVTLPITSSEKVAPTINAANSLGKFIVTVMPNPSTGNFRLNIQSTGSAPVNIRIMDVTGRVFESLNKQVFKFTNVTVTLGDNYKAGTYFAEINQGINRMIVTLIKL